MSVSVANQDPIWEQMVRGDQSQADILFHRHERELETFIKTQLRKFRRPESEWEDIAQECRLRILTLAQRLSLLHQHINTPALLTQLLAEFMERRDSAAPTQLSDLAGTPQRPRSSPISQAGSNGSSKTSFHHCSPRVLRTRSGPPCCRSTQPAPVTLTLEACCLPR